MSRTARVPPKTFIRVKQSRIRKKHGIPPAYVAPRAMDLALNGATRAFCAALVATLAHAERIPSAARGELYERFFDGSWNPPAGRPR